MGQEPLDRTDRVLDVRGMLCPLSTIMVINTLKEMPAGSVLDVITNNTGTRDAIPMLCSKAGCSLISTGEEDGLFRFRIKKQEAARWQRR